MNHNTKHIDNVDSTKGRDADFFSKVEVTYEKDPREIWDLMAKKLDEKPTGKVVHFYYKRVFSAIAASILILLGTYAVMRFYPKTIVSYKGEHLTALLPDGSTVELNAQSTLRYYPYWWRFSREIDFSGEGFFQIAKGSKLEVSSDNGKTIVLGTSFNIFSRAEKYKVTCLTGKVKVVSSSDKEAILTPDYHAEIDENGDILVKKLERPETSAGWVNNMFSFTSTPLVEVIYEIERQYDVDIFFPADLKHTYTGYFPKNQPVEQTLDLLCKAFVLTFVKDSEKEFTIVQK
jgi:ferric-dicitrate binding protein FerR (iron transport regulator)